MKTGKRYFEAQAPAPRTRRRFFARAAKLNSLAAILGLAAFLLGVACISASLAEEVIAVLSSASGAYAESLAGFEKEWGRSVQAVNMTSERVPLSRSNNIIIAFGAKAAMRQYPDRSTLIYWAPGLGVDQLDREGPAIKIWLGARPDILVARLKEIQPQLKNLGIFYVSAYYTRYIENMRRAARPFGITIHADKLDGTDNLPDRLRAMETKLEAVLMLNDPLFVNVQTFMILKNYSWANGVPLYAPTAGLVEQGATASIGPTFTELGRAAAQTARKALTGDPAGEEIYPEVNEISVNLTAASKTGVVFSEGFLKKVRRVFP